jgi:hypothetical protein
MATNEANNAPPQSQADHKPRRMLHVAGVLLAFSFILFLCQITNLGVFQANASGSNILPISIRADSQADYSADPHAFDVPPISESIFNQIITDIPGTGSPEQRMGTLQAALLSPVPTMTGSAAPLPSVTPTPSAAPSLLPTQTITASLVPTASATASPSPTPAPTKYAPPYSGVVPTSTKTRVPTKTATPQR